MNEPTQINDGGPAFPRPTMHDRLGPLQVGISLRCYIATAALQGLLANPRLEELRSWYTEEALFHANALIAALNKPVNKT